MGNGGCLREAVDALFCEVFHFRDDKICRLVTYQVDRHRDHETLRAFEP